MRKLNNFYMKIGNLSIDQNNKVAAGHFVERNGEKFYEIENFDQMQPFFISLASDTDLWMYISSTGGVTCGRKSPDMALFPYYTDDKITENWDWTGAKTLIKVQSGDCKASNEAYLWEPFGNRYPGAYDIVRRILKSVTGNQLIFEEENRCLGLTFSYRWAAADQYGWTRRAELRNNGDHAVSIEIVDGVQNVLPYGTDRQTQNVYSTLVDAYKKTELVAGTNLALFRMEAIMVDRAEPSEALMCNTCRTIGLDKVDYLLSSRQLDAIRMGAAFEPETEAKGVRGAMMAHTTFTLAGGESRRWYQLLEVRQDAADVHRLMAESVTGEMIEAAVAHTTAVLRQIVGQNDGIQQTADEAGMARHFANVLFNTMRGGFYCDTYQIQRDAFIAHVRTFNKDVYEQYKSWLQSLPETIDYVELLDKVSNLPSQSKGEGCHVSGGIGAQLHRLTLEYLPLTFSRRHGDPSRPWNLFNIRVNDENGNRLISYQGNWRDIFQNWEALSVSYPGYINGIISKFLNATTIDGYNPYRVTSEGIDWEVIVPNDPWSNIGYWGDHQIIYLLKLLELSYDHDPVALQRLLDQRLFAFANIPYRIKSYDEIVANPKDSILFDNQAHEAALALAGTFGADGKLVMLNGQPLLVTMADKLLITLLTKMSNLVPDGGIWMNTLRPEWNDANNALVGNGASMVTLCYMRRFVVFLHKMIREAAQSQLMLSREVDIFMKNIMAAMNEHRDSIANGFNDRTRRQFTDMVGKAGEVYRERVYSGGSCEAVMIDKQELLTFLTDAEVLLTQSIRNNKREDGLYNAYNLLTFYDAPATPLSPAGEKRLGVEYLYQMLEGQVAVLTSFALSAEEAVDLLDAMRHSDIYRADQNSYMLYPAKKLPLMLDKNNLTDEQKQRPCVNEMLASGELIRDCEGGIHFRGDYRNADDVQNVEGKVLWEDVFHHHAFTGRSGTFYKYEGLGSIYWHMVSKLGLAVAENIQLNSEALNKSNGQLNSEALNALIARYEDIKTGIGAHKSPAVYGSFPFDPYSHTPCMTGVQQPGMTGQVKEDILSRFIELGVRVENGCIRIEPVMLRREEFLNGQLSFTYCGVPFIYELAEQNEGTCLDAETSQHIFARDGKVKQVVCKLKID